MTMAMHTPVIITDGGPWAEHDVACPACGIRKAILDLGEGVFAPCHICRGSGWELVRWRTQWGKWRAHRRWRK